MGALWPVFVQYLREIIDVLMEMASGMGGSVGGLEVLGAPLDFIVRLRPVIVGNPVCWPDSWLVWAAVSCCRMNGRSGWPKAWSMSDLTDSR